MRGNFRFNNNTGQGTANLMTKVPCTTTLNRKAIIMQSNHWTLIDKKRGLAIEQLQVCGADISTAAAKLNVEYRRLSGGRQEGLHLLSIENGVIRISIIPERGMGIWKHWEHLEHLSKGEWGINIYIYIYTPKFTFGSGVLGSGRDWP